jgi:hypothetical protein
MVKRQKKDHQPTLSHMHTQPQPGPDNVWFGLATVTLTDTHLHFDLVRHCTLLLHNVNMKYLL